MAAITVTLCGALRSQVACVCVCASHCSCAREQVKHEDPEELPSDLADDPAENDVLGALVPPVDTGTLAGATGDLLALGNAPPPVCHVVLCYADLCAALFGDNNVLFDFVERGVHPGSRLFQLGPS